MPEPLPLEYARPTRPPGIVRATFILGLLCGPIGYGLGVLFSFLFDNIPIIWSAMASPFLTVAVLGVMAIASSGDERHRRRAGYGLAAAAIWAVALGALMAYAFLHAAI